MIRLIHKYRVLSDLFDIFLVVLLIGKRRQIDTKIWCSLLNAGKELSFRLIVWEMSDIMGVVWRKTENYRYFPHVVSIFFLVVHLAFFFFFFLLQRYFTNAISFLPYGDLTPRIRYSIGCVVVNLIEHKGFRYSSNAICNRVTYPIKSSYAIDCTPIRRQILDKFYPLLLHSCVAIPSRIDIHSHLELIKIYVWILYFCLKF